MSNLGRSENAVDPLENAHLPRSMGHLPGEGLEARANRDLAEAGGERPREMKHCEASHLPPQNTPFHRMRAELVRRGFLRNVDGKYRLTDAGHARVDRIKAVVGQPRRKGSP